MGDTSPVGSEPELVAIALCLVLAAAVGAAWGIRRAPAISVALVTGVVTGASAVWALSLTTSGHHGVPAMALIVASAALVASGLSAAILLPATGSGRSLRPVIVALLVAAPLAGLGVLLAVQHACPLYVGRRAGACYYEQDVLGGWSSGVGVLVALDVAALAAMLLITEVRSRRVEPLEVEPVLVSR